MNIHMERIFSVVNTTTVREAIAESGAQVQPDKDKFFKQEGELDPNKPMSLKDSAIYLVFKGVKKEIQSLNKEMIAKDNTETDRDLAEGKVDSLEKLGKASKTIKGSFDPQTKEVESNFVNAKLEPAFVANFGYLRFENGMSTYGAQASVYDSPVQTQMAFVEGQDGKITYMMAEGKLPDEPPLNGK